MRVSRSILSNCFLTVNFSFHKGVLSRRVTMQPFRTHFSVIFIKIFTIAIDNVDIRFVFRCVSTNKRRVSFRQETKQDSAGRLP